MKEYKIIGIVIIIIVCILLLRPAFIVEEGEQAVVLRFGKIIRTEAEAGLKFKTPLVDKVIYYPKKTQSWDGGTDIYPTGDKLYMWVEITARWKISDVKLFCERLPDIETAQNRLEQVIGSSARKVISMYPLREMVRNSNLINVIEPGEGTYESIKKGRDHLCEEISRSAGITLSKYGIRLEQVVIRRIMYSDDMVKKVYERMSQKK